MDNSVSKFLTPLIFNAAVACLLYGAYLALYKRFPRVYNLSTENSSQDAQFYIVYLKSIVTLFSIISFFSLVVLLPVNIVNQKDLIGLDLLSLANVEDANRLWAHFVIALATTALVCFFCYELLIEFKAFRKTVAGPRSVLVFNEALARFSGHKDLLKSKAKDLISLDKKRTEFVAKLEKTCSMKNVEKRPMHKPSFMSSEKVDSIEFYSEKIKTLDDEIHRLQQAISESEGPIDGAVATFNTTKAARKAAKSSSNYFGVRILPLNSPSDIYWPNVSLSLVSSLARGLVAVAAIAFLMIFWVVIRKFVD